MTSPALSCSWLRPRDLVNAIETLGLNATDIVIQCSNIYFSSFNQIVLFVLALGVSCLFQLTPVFQDLAKQGVRYRPKFPAVGAANKWYNQIRVSYNIQVTFTIFSTILPILFWIINLNSWHYLSAQIPLFRRLRRQIWRTNKLYSLSLLAVICSRYYYDSELSALEIVYLSQLTSLGNINTWMANLGEDIEAMQNGVKNYDWSVFLIGLVRFLVVCKINVMNPYPYGAMAKACRDHGNFLDVTSQLRAHDSRWNEISVLIWFLIVSLPSGLLSRSSTSLILLCSRGFGINARNGSY